MLKPGFPDNEAERLAALTELNILDTLPEPEFDDITKLASVICDTPIALIGLIDANRKWYKSKFGTDSTEIPREYALCSHTILKPDDMLLVPDSRKDRRFAGSPQVVNAPHVIFYAGVPITNKDGLALGTLCVIDHKPRTITDQQVESLKSLARQITKLFELRRKNTELHDVREKLEERCTDLEKFSYIMAHDMRAPLANIVSMIGILEKDHEGDLDDKPLPLLDHLKDSSDRLISLVDGILDYYKSDQASNPESEKVELLPLVKSITKMLDPDEVYQFSYPDNMIVNTSEVVLKQLFINLITNAIRYNNKEEVKISIGAFEDTNFYIFKVEDNGMGIEESGLNKIFNPFTSLGQKDRSGKKGSGIGLATVSKLVERNGGTISVTSEIGLGSCFEFTLKKPALK